MFLSLSLMVKVKKSKSYNSLLAKSVNNFKPFLEAGYFSCYQRGEHQQES